MAIACIPKEEVEKLKQGIRNGDFDISKLFEMTTAQRKDIFKKYTSSDMADFINKNFEKAMVSSWNGALKSWVKKTFTGSQAKKAKDITERIDAINEFITPERRLEQVEDIVSEQIGITVTPEEIDRITDYSNSLKALKDAEDDYGNPTKEYFIKRKELINYLNSINPNSKLEVAISVIGRGMMLFSIKSPFLNIESNTIFGATGALARRLSRRQFNGLNADQIIDYMKYATSLYSKTGYDVTIMEDIASDFVVRGETITHSQGKGAIRKTGRFFENFVFRKGQGVPDIFAESYQFADVANLESSKIALREGLVGDAAKQRALEMMKDALKIYPETPEGLTIRQKAKMEALYYTYKNQSSYTKLGLGSRELMNKFGEVFGVGKLGEVLAPFVKTPANVIGAGVDYSGGFAVKGLLEVYRGVKNRKFGMASEHFQKAAAYFIQMGLGLSFAYLVASMFKDDDYMPDYFSATASEKALAKQANIPFNSIKIMGKWVSFDYFGPLGAPLKAMIHARKYGDGPVNTMYAYSSAVVKQIFTFPGFQDLAEIMDSSWKTAAGKMDIKDALDDFYNGTIDFVSSRFIPAFLGDLAKGIDDSERKAEGLGTITSKIPGLREKLPEKVNIFGETIKTEPFLSTLFLGARMKTVNDDPVYIELERLLEQGELPSINDISKSSTRVKLVQENIGKDKFNEMVRDFGDEFKKRVEREIKSPKYKSLNDEDKKNKINAIKDEILGTILDKYGYQKYKKAEKIKEKAIDISSSK